MNKTLLTAAMVFAANFLPQNVKAQVVIPSANIRKDTVNIKNIYTARSNGFAFVSNKNDTLHVWRAANDYETADYNPHVTFQAKGTGYAANDIFTVETDATVFIADKLSAAQLEVLKKRLEGGTTLMNRAGSNELRTRFTY